MTDTRTALVHVSDDPRDVPRALSLAARLCDGDAALHVRVIVNGSALTELIGDEPVATGDRIRVEACEFGLHAGGHNTLELRPGVTTVPQAAAALIEGQFHGAAYLRV